MKHLKPLLSFAFAIVISFQAFSQIEVGAKVGTNINQFNQPGTIIGFHAGGFGRYKVLEFLTARAELMYNQLGGARQIYIRDYSFLGGNLSRVEHVNRYVNLHNLELPVIAELSHPDYSSDAVTPKLLLGFSYGLNLSAEDRHDKVYHFSSGSTERVMVSDFRENVSSNYKQHQFGFIAGFALDFKVGEHTLTTEIRYRRSLTQVNNIRFGTPALYNDLTDGLELPGTIGQEGDLYPTTLSVSLGMTIFNF